MTQPMFIITKYKVELMLKAKDQCYLENGSLEDLPNELKIAVISLYYENESIDEQKIVENTKSRDIKERKKYLEALNHFYSKKFHIDKYIKLVPGYILMIRNNRLDKRNYRKFIRESIFEITYGLSYQESSIITKLAIKIGFLRPIINMISKVEPL